MAGGLTKPSSIPTPVPVRGRLGKWPGRFHRLAKRGSGQAASRYSCSSPPRRQLARQHPHFRTAAAQRRERSRRQECRPPGLAGTPTTKGQWSGAPGPDGDDVGLFGPLSPRRSSRAFGTRPRCVGSPSEGFSRAKRRTRATTSSSRALGAQRPRRGYVQERATRSRCQRSSVARETRKMPQRSRLSDRSRVASTARSVGEYRGRATWRRSTAS